MVRSARRVGALFVLYSSVFGAVLASGSPAFAEDLPANMLGRWGREADCRAQGVGLILEGHTLSIAGLAGQQVLLTVEVSDVHGNQARLTVRRVTDEIRGTSGPQVGDVLVLERSGKELRPIQAISGGRKTDLSAQPGFELCK